MPSMFVKTTISDHVQIGRKGTKIVSVILFFTSNLHKYNNTMIVERLIRMIGQGN